MSSFFKFFSVALLVQTVCVGAWTKPTRVNLNNAKRDTEPDPDYEVPVSLDGVTYINKGLVAFGLIASDFVDDIGDTFGGVGSAIALQSFSQLNDTAYEGVLIVQPDRGYNVEGTVNYQARQHSLSLILTPYYSTSTNLSFTSAQSTLQITYTSSLLYTERQDKTTTGLDALGVRAANSSDGDPGLPIPGTWEGEEEGVDGDRLSLDCEGLVLLEDGSFWMSDEYGPYIYKFTSSGSLDLVIQPSEAILPLNSSGGLNFTSAEDPTTGRAANQGFEGLTIDPTYSILYALLQSATIQDGGDDDETSRYTRLVAYDITVSPPSLTGEWIVPLPITNNKGKTLAASELHYVSDGVFLVLSRDSKGRGSDDDDDSSHKTADLISISSATNIANTEYDDPSNSIIDSDDVLVSNITPATYVSFVDYLDNFQLARFGLHNGDPDDETLIDSKWESLALVKVGDSEYPDDYFLFTVADNDFMTTNGTMVGVSYDAGEDVDTQFLVFRITLPGVDIPDLS